MSHKIIYNNKTGCLQKCNIQPKKNNSPLLDSPLLDIPLLGDTVVPDALPDDQGSLESIDLKKYMSFNNTGQVGMGSIEFKHIEFSSSISTDTQNVSARQWTHVSVDGFLDNKTPIILSLFGSTTNTFGKLIITYKNPSTQTVIVTITLSNVIIVSYKLSDIYQYITFSFETIEYLSFADIYSGRLKN
jgi:hypothetical protein